MEKQNRIRAYKGDPVNPGVSRKTAGINFAVEIPCGISASLVLYRKGAALPEVEIPFTEEHRTGRMCAILISGLKPDKYEYNFRAAGKIIKCFHSKKTFQQFFSGLHIIIKERIVTAHCCRCRYGLSCSQGNLRRSRCRYSQRILRLSRS